MCANILIFVQLFVYLHQINKLYERKRTRAAWHPKDVRWREALATVTVVQDGCHRVAVLHSLLYLIVRPDAIAHQRSGKRCFMDRSFRIGQDLSVWGLDNFRRRGIQTIKE